MRIPHSLRALALAAAALALPMGSHAQAPASPSASASDSKSDAAFASLQAGAKGFTTGPMAAKNEFLVFFDPQCPHCAHLWQASLPFQSKIRIKWVPVAALNKSSLPQGAAIMLSKNPAAAMGEHEAAMATGHEGIALLGAIPKGASDDIMANTRLLFSLGVDRVPFITGRNARTGQLASKAGAVSEAELATLLGIDSATPKAPAAP